MAEYGGWTGQVLRVDLSKGKISSENTIEKYKDFLGGTGLGYKVLWDEVPAPSHEVSSFLVWVAEKKSREFRGYIQQIRKQLPATEGVQEDVEIARAQRQAILSMETVRFGPGPTGREHDEVLYGSLR